jgi:hypothetical protein
MSAAFFVRCSAAALDAAQASTFLIDLIERAPICIRTRVPSLQAGGGGGPPRPLCGWEGGGLSFDVRRRPTEARRIDILKPGEGLISRDEARSDGRCGGEGSSVIIAGISSVPSRRDLMCCHSRRGVIGPPGGLLLRTAAVDLKRTVAPGLREPLFNLPFDDLSVDVV